MNHEQAIQFVKSQGNPVEQARLRFILANEPPSLEVVATLFAGQRADGGWAPFWTQNYSSLDATCFRLAQAHQLGLGSGEPAVRQAVRFLSERQTPEGSWEEEARVSASTPCWARPGDPAARLYLTANCGFWFKLLDGQEERAFKAAAFLQARLDDQGKLPSFMQANWLAGGLWHLLGWHEPAEGIFRYLSQNLAGLAASELAWLLTTLHAARVEPDHLLMLRARSLLDDMQQLDGKWLSADGPDYEVHATLEALRALSPR